MEPPGKPPLRRLVLKAAGYSGKKWMDVAQDRETSDIDL
jgi:hypothetical protein